MQNQSISRKRFIRRMGATLAAGFAFFGLASLAQGATRSKATGTGSAKMDGRCTRDLRTRAYKGPEARI